MDKRFTPIPGETYAHTNGDKYVCKRIEFGVPVLERVSDSWILKAHGVRRNEDGEIYWAFSKGGGWKQSQLRLLGSRRA